MVEKKTNQQIKEKTTTEIPTKGKKSTKKKSKKKHTENSIHPWAF